MDLRRGGRGGALVALTPRQLPSRYFYDPLGSALFEAICFSTLRHYRRYRHVLDTWMQRPLRERDVEVQCLLLAGLVVLFAAISSTHDERVFDATARFLAQGGSWRPPAALAQRIDDAALGRK